MNKFLLLQLIFLLFIFVGCQKEEVESRIYPRINTLKITDITTDGATFNAEVLSLGVNDIIEYGFFWDTIPNFNYQTSYRVKIKEFLGKEKFKCTINESLLKGITYYVRSYVYTNGYIVVGDDEEFVSKGSMAPQINSFYPKNGSWGDTITIAGERFNPNNNDVYLGSLRTKVVYNSDALLKVIVPSETNEIEVKIILKTPDYTVSSDDAFNYFVPIVESFSPQDGTFGDVVFINGDFSQGSQGVTSVLFRGVESDVISSSPFLLQVKVPDQINDPILNICVSINGNVACSNESFALNSPVIESVSNTEVHIGDNVFINGQNFNPLKNNNIVQVDGFRAEILSASNQFLEIEIPDEVFVDREVNITVETARQMNEWNESIHIVDEWLNKGNIPDYGYSTSAVFNFEYQQFGYTAFNDDNTIVMYKYDPSKNSWHNISTFPGYFRYKMTAFVIGGYAYIGGYYGREFWRYDIENNSWQQIEDFPLDSQAMTSFAANDEGYVICTTQQEDNFWKYSTEDDVWSKLEDFKPDNTWNAYADISFAHAGKGYVLTKDGSTRTDEFWEYEPYSKTWNRLADQIDDLFYKDRSAFVIGDYAYLLPDAYYPNCYKYSFTSNNWTLVGNADGRHQAVCFTIDDVAYVGGGHNFANSLKDFWEFKPNQ